MKKLKQIGSVHFYVPDEADAIFSIITDICVSIEQYVFAVRCEKNYGEIEFKYFLGAEHYSIKCGFNKHHMLLMDRYRPLSNFKYGVNLLNFAKYNLALDEDYQIARLHNMVLENIKKAFLKANSKK